MPIYEFACSHCRVVYNFFSPRINPERTPVCPKCGNRKLTKQLSTFALTRGGRETDPPAGEGAPGAGDVEGNDLGMPDLEDPKLARAMGEMERDMAGMDESNPRHLAHLMRKMQGLLPGGAMPKDMEAAIKRLEAGEDPEKIEADMGDVLGDFLGEGPGPGGAGGGGRGGAYQHDAGLYDY